ncbi:uncharacterized protein LOC123922366 [Trifolium pratense]|uniref:uncharacterized protein LOC123922366 n=1 Tax=Trifolium pratense TaxID=57577 RepID=UPI001E692415|nr:uncharacterized protein LOC123922366 [Trifolium pratense]
MKGKSCQIEFWELVMKVLKTEMMLTSRCDRVILTPKNSIVDLINEYMLLLIDDDENVYLRYDSPNNDNSGFDKPDDIHTPEFLNTIVCSGLPNHKLILKFGVSVMLLRNIDPAHGLCNETRLIVTKMRQFIIEGNIISESNICDKVFIPGLSLTPSNIKIPFKFQCR